MYQNNPIEQSVEKPLRGLKVEFDSNSIGQQINQLENKAAKQPRDIMIRNPFKKSDGGCSFVCVVVVFLLVQISYIYFYLDPAFMQDNKQVMIDLAAEKGFVYNQTSR